MNNNTFSRWKESLHLKILSGYLILGLLVLGIITAVCAYSGGYPFSISGDIRSVPS